MQINFIDQPELENRTGLKQPQGIVYLVDYESLKNLIIKAAKYDDLERGGVDNWMGYGEDEMFGYSDALENDVDGELSHFHLGKFATLDMDTGDLTGPISSGP